MKPNDPLNLRKRKRRIRPAISTLIIGGTLLSLSYIDTQTRLGVQRRETIITQQYVERSKSRIRFDPIILSVTIFVTSTTSYTVPSDWNSTSNSIETLSGGGNSSLSSAGVNYSSGGAGGNWAKATNVTLTPSASVTIQVGGATADTWFNGATLATSSVGCKGGASAVAGTGGAPGNTALSRGGAGGGITNPGAGFSNAGGSGGSGGLSGGGSGGGAAGSTGAGNNGGVGSNGGSGDAGSGGAGGILSNSASGTAGGNGTEWDASHGSGGGGGGTTEAFGTFNGSSGGNYGGGAGCAGTTPSTVGAGAQGIIVLIYTPGSNTGADLTVSTSCVVLQ